MTQKQWESVARLSVLSSLGFTLFCAGIYLIEWTSTGQGSWSKLLQGSLNIAGPVALIVWVMGAFLTNTNRPDGGTHWGR
jgi:hypothetical protein